MTEVSRQPDYIPAKTLHEWSPNMQDYSVGSDCIHCHVNDHSALGTIYCEDYAEIVRIHKEKKERRHAPTEAAWVKLQGLLTKEEWELLELRSKHGREHRIIDRIG